MKRTGRFDLRRKTRGFTLIELMIAITILAVVAVLSWRGLDQIIRGRQAISLVMANERVLAQTFDQMGSDVRNAVSDDEAGGEAIRVAGGELRVVRRLELAGQASRLEVIRYEILDRQLVRAVSPPIATVGQLRAAKRSASIENWSRVVLMRGVSAMNTSAFVDKQGWVENDAGMREAVSNFRRAANAAMRGNAPTPRAVTGVRVEVVITTQSNASARYTRAYRVGQ